MVSDVGGAMQAERPAKQQIRRLWLEKIKAYLDGDTCDADAPLYMTLCGSEALDIAMLVEAEIIQVTETGAVSDESADCVVAIESNHRAQSEIRRKYPGLRVKPGRYEDVLRSHKQTTWPEGEDRWLCSAKVINLDLNSALKADLEGGRLVFPLIEHVIKLAELHRESGCAEWSLFVTVQASINWAQEIVDQLMEFLSENMAREERFKEGLCDCFGSDADEVISIARQATSSTEQVGTQRLLMTLLPKILAHELTPRGWRVRTEKVLRYGGESNTAAMVSWIFDLESNPHAKARPDYYYREAIGSIFKGFVNVAENGNLSKDA